MRYQPRKFLIELEFKGSIFCGFVRVFKELCPSDRADKSAGTEIWRKQNVLHHHPHAAVEFMQNVVHHNDAFIDKMQAKSLDIKTSAFVSVVAVYPQKP